MYNKHKLFYSKCQWRVCEFECLKDVHTYLACFILKHVVVVQFYLFVFSTWTSTVIFPPKLIYFNLWFSLIIRYLLAENVLKIFHCLARWRRRLPRGQRDKTIHHFRTKVWWKIQKIIIKLENNFFLYRDPNLA